MTRVPPKDRAGRYQARRLYAIEKPCEVCGKGGSGRGVIDRHHRDSDRSNNTPENIAFLCRKHHMAAHRASDGRVGGGARPRIVAMNRAVSAAHYQEAAALRSQGHSYRSIARVMGVAKSSVDRWVRTYGPFQEETPR
jgi:hypothetical protein